MGMFDIFSRKEDDARKATLDELVRQTAAERERIGHDLAAIEARRASVAAWFTANRTAIVTDYGRLLDAFLSRDAAAVGRAVTAAEDRILVVAAIPVYYNDGVTTVTFAEMAAQVFPEHPGLAKRLAAEPGTLPGSAFTARKMEEFYKPDTTAMDARFLKDPDAVKKMSGNYRENLTLWTDHFRMVLDGLRINGNNDIARKESTLAESNRAELERITLVAARHRSLIDAFDRADADAVIKTLQTLRKAEKINDMIALGTGRDGVADFTALTFKSFTDPEAAARIYNEMLACGQPVHLTDVVSLVTAPEPTLPPSSLTSAFMHMVANDKKPSAIKLMTMRDQNGKPLLATALGSESLMAAVLSPSMGDASLQAAALLGAAAQLPDGSNEAAALRDRADALIARGDFVIVAPGVRVRAAAMDAVEYSNGSLRYSVAGNSWYDKMSAESGGAVIRVMANLNGIIALNDTAAVNAAHGINVWDQKSGKNVVSVMTATGTNGHNVTTGDPETILERFGSQPGWIMAAGEAFNVRAIDNCWAREKKDGGKDIKLMGRGREFYCPVDESAIAGVMDTFVLEDPALERVGGELMRMTDVAHTRLAIENDKMRLEFLSPKNGVLHIKLTEEEGPLALRRFESAHGHMLLSPSQTLAPAAVENLRLVKNSEGEKTIGYNAHGKSYVVENISPARAVDVVKETARLLPYFHAASLDMSVNMRRVDAIRLTAEGITYITGDKNVTAPGGREDFARLVASYGLLTAGKNVAVNPARINLMFYEDGKMNFTNGSGRVSVTLPKAEAERIMDAVCAAAIPANDTVYAAEKKLAGQFTCAPAWPEAPKKDDEGPCAPPSP